MAERLFKMLLIFSILIVWPFHIVAAEDVNGERDLWRDLNKTSDTILHYVKQGHYEDAKQLLEYFSEQFLEIKASDYDLTMRELQVITSVYEEATEAAVSVSLSHEDRVKKASKLRLLVDVYDSSSQPLWKGTKDSLFAPLTSMRNAVNEGDAQKFQQALNLFVENYETVRPAWGVSLSHENYYKTDSQIQYLKSLRSSFGQDSNLAEHLKLMENQLIYIYDGTEDGASDPSLIWVMLTIGGAIIFALSYTGWRKYRAEQEKEKELKRKRRRI
ncbi:sporulation protein YpjB [Evansella tamaricis]|uniref:Sporulation protein YpjB n=1 Tax=Evansella tamaricis TaxID=2069301 RepID=A0ABS6JHI3_9BACI|nr:sporulation protein YpjB [Evansella tamaricis]MBU9711803.1 sporulation protein YpjB [Evansella tamaricis]